MSSTDAERDGVLVALFEREFGRAARLLSEQHVQLLAAGPDTRCASYYIERQSRAMNPGDFQLNLEALNEVKRALHGLCQGPEAFILAELSEKILALAPRYASVEEVEALSPFIYVMF